MSSPAARQTTAYFAGHVALGLMSAVLGPTIPALAAGLGREPEALGILFAVRSLGYLLASLLAGPVYDRVRGHGLLAGALLVIAAGLITVPLAPSRLALIGVLAALGLAQGVLDVGNNLLLTRVHGARVAPYMSALHCAYGVGALIAPLVVAAASNLYTGYGALALAMLPVAAWIVITPGPRPQVGGATDASAPAAANPPRALALLLLWFALCIGVESGFSGWLFTIAAATGLSDTDASRLLSGFWAAFTLGRLLSIVAAARVLPQRLLAGAWIGAVVSVVILLVVPGAVALVVASVTLGLALAPVFPASMSWAAARVRLDGAATGKLFVGASLGSMAMPWLLGYTLGLGPRGPLALLLIALLLAGLVFRALARGR